MGPVEINAYTNQGRVTVKSLPLTLAFGWDNISSLEELTTILKYEPRFVFVQDVLTFQYHQERLENAVQLFEDWFKGGNTSIPLFTATDIKTAEGYKSVLLPFGPAVSSIGFGMAEKNS